MSSQVESGGRSGNAMSSGKRARTDGGRREDDWTCPSCGNVNFSFRTTCNMRSCNQSRPSPSSFPKHHTPSYTPPPPAYVPPAHSMYIAGSAAAPAYGALTRYELAPPFHHAGGSAYPTLSYGGFGGGRLSLGSPYGALHVSTPPPYSAASMLSAGGMYGVPALVGRYGLSLTPSQDLMGSRSGSYADDRSQKKGGGTMRENDWKCPKCGNVNFSFRTVCNMRKCNTPKPENQGSNSGRSKSSKAKMPEGSWVCEKCKNINYPFRTKCNRQDCGAEKPLEPNDAIEQDGAENDQ